MEGCLIAVYIFYVALDSFLFLEDNLFADFLIFKIKLKAFV